MISRRDLARYLSQVMVLEKRMFRGYTRMYRYTKTPKYRRLFGRLVREEARHIRRVDMLVRTICRPEGQR